MSNTGSVSQQSFWKSIETQGLFLAVSLTVVTYAYFGVPKISRTLPSQYEMNLLIFADLSAWSHRLPLLLSLPALIWYCIRACHHSPSLVCENSLPSLAVLPQQTSCSQSSPSAPPIFPNVSASHVIATSFFPCCPCWTEQPAWVTLQDPCLMYVYIRDFSRFLFHSWLAL